MTHEDGSRVNVKHDISIIKQRIGDKAGTYNSMHMVKKYSNKEQEVLERTNLPTFLTLFKNVICIKTSVCPNITSVGNSVPILKHSHTQNNVSYKRIVGSS
jgi:hypothetical protein